MANRRLGVQYPVKYHESLGTPHLPAPNTRAPPLEESLNRVQEYRPDYNHTPQEDESVAEFLYIIKEDVWNAWEQEHGDMEEVEGVNKSKVSEGSIVSGPS
jgi:hypothetical protein